jgi:hypothetical protein
MPRNTDGIHRTEYGKLLAIQARLAEPKALTPNEQRDLAVAMQRFCILPFALIDPRLINPMSLTNAERLPDRSAIGTSSIQTMRS